MCVEESTYRVHSTMFVLPNFNLMLGVWIPPNLPFRGDPDFNIPAQVYVNSRDTTTPAVDATGGPGNLLLVSIRVPREIFTFVGPPIVGYVVGYSPAILGHFQYFLVQSWEFTHSGFPNEYVSLYCFQCTDVGSEPDSGR